MEINTTKVSEDPVNIRETMQNNEETSGNVMTHEVGEDTQLNSSKDAKAPSKDETPKSLQSKKRASLIVEMEDDKESRNVHVTGNGVGKTSIEEPPAGGDKISPNDDGNFQDKTHDHSVCITGGKPTSKAETQKKDGNGNQSVTASSGNARSKDDKTGIETEPKSVERYSDKSSVEKAIKSGKPIDNQPTTACEMDTAYAKAELRQRKKSAEQPAKSSVSDAEKKGWSFKSLMRGMF